MKIDLSSPSTLISPSQDGSQMIAFTSAANSKATMLISTQVQAPILNNAQINHFDTQLPNEKTQYQQQNAAPENNSLSPLEQRILNNNNYHQQKHVQKPDLLKSCHDPDNMFDDINDNYDSDVVLRGDISLY